MKNQELIDRYVYAVTKQLPRKQAEDIDRELHGLIEDMLTERCRERPAEQKDVLVILTELGTPQELAVQYSDDKDSCLIGQPYYNQYKAVLKWVLLAVVFGLTVAMIVGFVIHALEGNLTGLEAAAQIAGWLGSLLASTLGVIGGMTVVYAFLQRKGIRLEENAGLSASLTDLPPVPVKKEKVSRADAIANIILSVLFLCVFLFVPGIIVCIFEVAGEKVVIPYFNLQAVRGIWYPFAGMAVCGIVQGMAELTEGRYTLRLAAVNGICGLVSIILCALFVTTKGIVNPQLWELSSDYFRGDEEWLGTVLLPNLLYLVLAAVVLACVLDFGITLFRALRYGGRRKEKP